MKKYLFVGILSFLILGCTNTPKRVELTPEEIVQVKNNNVGAELLIKKALLKEMSEYKYTIEEKNELDSAKENIEIEFFLNNRSSKNVVVTDEEVLQIYEANKEQLKGIKPEIALPQIKEQLFLQKLNQEKVNYINSLVEKYNMNEKIKEYFPVEK